MPASETKNQASLVSSRRQDAGAPTALLLNAMTTVHKEWYSRGYLPHFDYPDILQGITFHLDDSLPAVVVERMKRKAKQSPHPERELRTAVQRYLDAGHGACYLKEPALARTVEHALLHFDGQRYRLLAWVIMPNHVHLLVEIIEGYPLHEVIHSWKSFTAQEINKALKRRGTFWQREYFDRFIRNEKHLRKSIRYIHNNPVKAGLVANSGDFPFSSARFGEQRWSAGILVGT